ncbi:hypothetical protein [Flavobacterium kingsejongi]|uniref:Uncharacterized protein n=1 Tax=Flavobacterium kingsejongi TaxID=1678728 RepID=A0A2S1LP68_9FLAO|nr:hypothetical protein [Flavobacterium kingsejongi]AWG25534.1 hypothetical protein FK004_09945 [Flavobacterium kingsejongi]
MRRYLELSFFAFISPNSKANLSPQKLHTAYEEFVEVIFGDSETECNITCYYNRLIYTRVELESIQANLQIGSKKNALIGPYLSKAVAIIDAQLNY